MRFWRGLAAVGLLAGLSACAEMAEGLSYVAADMQAQNGEYYPDYDNVHNFGSDDGVCTGRLDFGRRNNQNYFRVVNLSDRTFTYTLDFRGGVTVEDTLSPHSAGGFIYKPPSIEWDTIRGSCRS
jgi:hypothetical protein